MARKVIFGIDIFDEETLSIEISNAVTAIVALFEPRPERSKSLHLIMANYTELL